MRIWQPINFLYCYSFVPFTDITVTFQLFNKWIICLKQTELVKKTAGLGIGWPSGRWSWTIYILINLSPQYKAVRYRQPPNALQTSLTHDNFDSGRLLLKRWCMGDSEDEGCMSWYYKYRRIILLGTCKTVPELGIIISVYCTIVQYYLFVCNPTFRHY